MKIDVFCDVIDNYGDAGVCLRLCRDLCNKKLQVRLFCNNLSALSKIKNSKDDDIDNLSIYKWPSKKELENFVYESSDVVIQAFSTRLPEIIFNKIKEKKSLVINLEYLTAERFADDCHKLPSFSDGYQSYFFFPGFTNKTGGVTIEDEFIKKLNKQITKTSVTLFSYENENIKDVVDSLKNLDFLIDIYIFEGRALNNFNNLYKKNMVPGDNFKDKNICFIAKQMVSQDEYDELLINSYINLVRGEDSIVRAMLTGRPFLWHIYFQEENAHKDKINALFDRMKEVVDDNEGIEIFREINLNYNNFGNKKILKDLHLNITRIEKICKKWQQHLLSLGSLSDNLLTFIREKI
ncbi:MAG: elongation factor P maturation arginine rhamnosyltransferase EarP [Succinivibrio sp.]|nr:elongation factor P maturation arginine rhamnosyltransferase EarP [Succinivibrio sp.]